MMVNMNNVKKNTVGVLAVIGGIAVIKTVAGIVKKVRGTTVKEEGESKVQCPPTKSPKPLFEQERAAQSYVGPCDHEEASCEASR